MFLVTLILFNFVLLVLIAVYCKITCGYCTNNKHLVGKVVIVTGANAGIGYETAKNLAERGARVILGCRNVERGTKAKDKIIAETGNKDVFFYHLDLASLKSVRKFVDEFLKNEERLDVLINNAGIGASEQTTSEDGLSYIMQTNHFGPFLLTNLLLPILKSSAPSRIINVSSSGHSWSELDLNDLNMRNKTYSVFQMYCNTKLCNILMTVKLAKILEGTGVTANSLHPGVVDTEIMGNYLNSFVKMLLRSTIGYIVKTPWEGAQTSIYLAVAPEAEDITGQYFSDCHQRNCKRSAQDPVNAQKLWEESERLVKLEI